VSGVIFLAYKYAEDPARALAVNAELSGDNCHRGSLLGAILGLGSVGQTFVSQELEVGLHNSDQVAVEANAFGKTCAELLATNGPPTASLRLSDFLREVVHVAAPPKSAEVCLSG